MDGKNRRPAALSDDALEKVIGGTGYILTGSDFEATLCRLTTDEQTQWGGGNTEEENLRTLCGLVNGESSF